MENEHPPHFVWKKSCSFYRFTNDIHTHTSSSLSFNPEMSNSPQNPRTGVTIELLPCKHKTTHYICTFIKMCKNNNMIQQVMCFLTFMFSYVENYWVFFTWGWFYFEVKDHLKTNKACGGWGSLLQISTRIVSLKTDLNFDP